MQQIKNPALPLRQLQISAVAQVQSLALDLPHAMGVAKRKKEKKKLKKKKQKKNRAGVRRSPAVTHMGE